MKQSLHLNVNQQLILTPQLQQAIRLLQLSTVDLEQEIQRQLESNPMLEAAEEEPNNLQPEKIICKDNEVSEFQWSETYTRQSNNTLFNDRRRDDENLYKTSLSLQDHLRWQLELTPMSKIDKAIGTTIIDAINEDGFLTDSPTDLHMSLNSEAYPLDFAEVEAVRHRIQLFDPIGCAAIDLAETLLIQLKQLPTEMPHVDLAKQMIHDHILLLGKHDYQQLMKIYLINEATLDHIIQIILHLHPKPGSVINEDELRQITPDLITKKNGHQWQVQLNPCVLPHLSINRYYASLLRQTSNGRDQQFLKHNLQEARWFIKSLHSRQETLLKVAAFIVDSQKDFLEFGDEAMKPLILNDVAHALDMHESTISRVTTQKYIVTPRGLFELKYFFSSHVPTELGGGCSSIAIRAVIKKLIAAENHDSPLSDSKIADLMNEQGVKIARRTVAKYRETMFIAPSSERKSIRIKSTMEGAGHNNPI